MDEILIKKAMYLGWGFCIVIGMLVLYFSMDRFSTYDKAKTDIENQLKPFFENHVCIEVAGKPKNLTNSSFALVLSASSQPSCKCDPVSQQLLCN